MKGKSSFEERLISFAGESALKQAKQLLKQDRLRGAFRSGDGRLHAVFGEKNNVVHTAVQPGEPPVAECDCAAAGTLEEGRLCAHALALLMYSGQMKTSSGAMDADDGAVSYSGLKNAGLEALSRDCPARPEAEVVIQAESAFPHVPSKWENATLAVRLRCGKREYLGNLSNLRQLFFEKTLAVMLKLEQFSMQDRQIIRFLAINGEADSSHILLNSEMTAEFFHSLGNFDRFFRNNRRLIVHTEANARPVILEKRNGSGREYSPGIRFRGALLEVHSAKVITGRSGCWVGKSGEYFWVPADCEVAFLRNFFRLGRWSDDAPGSAVFLEHSPLECVRIGRDERAVEPEPCTVVLQGGRRGGGLEIKLHFAYGNRMFPPDGGRLVPSENGRFWHRCEELEADVVHAFALLRASGDPSRGELFLSELETIGLFLDEILPDWLRKYPNLALGAELSGLAGGGVGLPRLTLKCEAEDRTDAQDCFSLRYCWHDGRGGEAGWKVLAQAARTHARCIALDNGNLAVLPPQAGESLLKLSGMVQKLDETAGTFALPRVMLHYYAYLTREWPEAMPAGLLRHLVPQSVRLPDGGSERPPLRATLRGYQQEGVEWLVRMLGNHFNVILADEMGLGKTVQALAALRIVRPAGAPPALVVCPASLVENWQRETERFLPESRIGVLYGMQKDAVLEHLEEFDLVIVSYTLVRREVGALRKHWFSMVILDEAQHIKNPGTANAQSCKALKTGHKLVLTGTPLENSPDDLWSIFDFLHPGLLGSFSGFRKSYADVADSPALQAELAARVAPFIKRRNKAVVAPELPPREEHLCFCSMEPPQREFYERILAEGRSKLAALEEHGMPLHGNSFEILTTLLRLRQICCHPVLAGEGAEKLESAKFELLKELVMEHIDSHHKMLLFSQFTSLLALVRSWLEEKGIRYCYLDGATRNRQAEVDEFNRTPDIPIFLLSLKAGGTGLNLTSADTVIIYDPWWNPAAELQAADRTHRIGQTKPVRTLKLLVNDSIEEKILQLQTRKQDIFDQVVDNPGAAADKLTLEELKYLLQ